MKNMKILWQKQRDQKSSNSLLLFCIGLFIAGLMPNKLLACDPNDPLPAALPPAPNGGIVSIVKPVEEVEVDALKDELQEETELYWEGYYDSQQQEVRLQLLSIIAPKTAIFSRIDPSEYLTKIKIEIERPRKKIRYKARYELKNGKISLPVDLRDEHRFIVHVTGFQNGQLKKSLIQIELDS